ncbi:hypothetical protein E2C01_008795 [Portunus trituberculatus]|uniref:Uncharacterized protein n=1 Tax=Portunus trituberculatus TaxID=210409 RepID=A0A5B7D2W6_PORTR|nr:hypothetical protein [Portunus trituberculatus]
MASSVFTSGIVYWRKGSRKTGLRNLMGCRESTQLLRRMDVYLCLYTIKDNLQFAIKRRPPRIWMVQLAGDSAGRGVTLVLRAWTRLPWFRHREQAFYPTPHHVPG